MFLLLPPLVILLLPFPLLFSPRGMTRFAHDVVSVLPGRYLHPEELEVLEPTLVPAAAHARAASNNAETQEGGDGGPALVPSSRKDPATRRRELLAFLREPLREVCAAHADELMRSKFAGSLVLLEAMQVMTSVEW